MSNVPDELYTRSREELLDYEDSRYSSLIQAVANFYTIRNDQSLWGAFLRALAIELAKLEYAYAYDVVGKDPTYLTPPDAKRRWADPLFISRNYPTKDQFDRDFKSMIVDLIKAYRKGCTVEAISEVLLAYTGKTIEVQELYKQIGVFYDESARNTLKIDIKVGGPDPLSDIENLNQLSQVTQSLFGALYLAKPAHVGLLLSLVFGSDEGLDCWLSPRFLNQFQYLTLPTDEQAYYTLASYALQDGLGIIVGRTLTVGSGGNLETVTVTATALGSFKANFTKTHLAGTTIKNGLSVITTLQNPVTVTGLQFAVPVSMGAAPLATSIPGVTEPLPLVLTISQFENNLLRYSSGTASPAHITTAAYRALTSTQKAAYAPDLTLDGSRYQEFYQNLNCTGSGLDDTLNIYLLLKEDQPLSPSLRPSPILDPINPQTTIAGYGRLLQPVLTSGEWNALPGVPGNALPGQPSLQSAYTLSLGSYLLNYYAVNWIMYVDDSNNPTGLIGNWDPAHPMGLLGPRLNTTWEVVGEQEPIFDLD
jgi:hypothetical protein